MEIGRKAVTSASIPAVMVTIRYITTSFSIFYYLVDPEKPIFTHNSSFYNPHSTTIAKATDKG